ncbi:ABC transporter substrate-binding protein [Actinocatenispora thailandica]|uniref:ABC transporter substrate-binding protein n=1 Tax=Actinocatenispora thailandica TaxID=227318 RepID=A0A7R7HZU4_9ACTN|nr:MCE family protein [Actinocatenispora thailandica]BCJ37896.1 ABC transporter substrate-binding protein [Actinocatenispora thailandica]
MMVRSHRDSRSLGVFRSRLGIGLAVAVVAVLGTAIGLAVWRMGPPQKTLTAYFSQSVGIYANSDVRVMGVKIGHVTAVRPGGRTVAVSMTYDADYEIPAKAKAVIVPPSIVGDRYVQLTPGYVGGAVLSTGAVLRGDRAVVPLELDDVYKALNNLSVAVGPNGANKNGSLNNLIRTGAKNLKGNGKDLNQTLRDLAAALDTVSDGRQDLFGTVVNLQKFTTALAESDGAVRQFNKQLADVSEQLSNERDDLAAALKDLGTALKQVATFVKTNRKELSDNVAALTDITGVLVKQQKSIIDVLDLAPTALSNLNLAYNARSGTLDTRDDIIGPYDPASYVCSLVTHLVPVKQVPVACFELAAFLAKAGSPLTTELKHLLNLLPIPGLNLGAIIQPDPDGTTGGTDRVGQKPVDGETTPQGDGSGGVASDPTLGGILGGGGK